ncbi:hypothetical protein H376_450 [Rickettsia prowazekii str. GvF12]|nr:hypothetical protein H376_450 [Rickettsia prowazekii str. GvF12]
MKSDNRAYLYLNVQRLQDKIANFSSLTTIIIIDEQQILAANYTT